jgi:pseudouridine-5'-phosphate glycosidase
MKDFPLTAEHLRVTDEVAEALRHGLPVVALETTIVVHGLPAPVNLEVAQACETAVRSSGAIPATIGVLDGVVRVGMGRDDLARLADPDRGAVKLSARDLGVALSRGVSGATTVAGTIAVAHRVGISVMATGGLGGVHRGATETFDESADLTTLSRTPVLVVASGVKSILDIGATLERLDSLGVPVWGYRCDSFPAFYRSESAFRVEWRLESPEEVARAFARHREWSSTGALLAHPVASDRQLDESVHDDALARALDRADAAGVAGKAVTPAVLSAFAELTGGRSVVVNQALVVANAALAGAVAAAS